MLNFACVTARLGVPLVLLWTAAASAETAERIFSSATAESVLASCQEKAAWQQGFCRGFIEALAVRLADTREFCAYWPVNLNPLVAEALDTLSEADKDASAWKVIEQRLAAKHLPPCK